MSGAVRPLRSARQPPGGQFGHCPAEEYVAFVKSCSRSVDKQNRMLHRHKRFVAHFLDLNDWFDQPLRQRLGWRNKDTQTFRLAPGEGFDVTAGWINYNAREYLVYLALTGRLRLDWGWLLGIGQLKPWWIADDLGLPLTAQIEQLRQRTIDLGHTPDGVYKVSWTIVRLVLRRGDPDLHAVTADDVEAMRQAIRDVDQIPGIEQVLTTQQRQRLISSWGTSVFRAGVTLFHASITDRTPARLVPAPRAAWSSRPRVNAVIDRYLAERGLIVRPESLSSTRGAMRRFGLWLDEQRPGIVTLAELNRADLVEFMTWLQHQRKIKHPEQPLSDAYKRCIISEITVLFRHAAHAEWPDVPTRPVLLNTDIPRAVQRIPRYIPTHQLEPIMTAVRALECPLQRCALLVARWSGG